MKRIIYTLLGMMLSVGAWADGVAKIDETEYATLQEAFNAATTGQTVQLIADVQLADYLNVNSGKDVTLDLNSHTIAPTDDHVKTNYCIILVHRGAKLTVDDTSVGKIGCIDGGTGANAYYGGILLTQNDDTGTEAATLVVNNGIIRGDQAAITGNGTRHNTNVTINGGTFTASSTVAGSEGCAIYHPQNGTLTITGGTFTGYASAVEMRSGTLNITGGTFTATATEYSCKANGNGTTTIGAALAIAQHTTKQDIAVNISGGTFSGVQAVSEANPQENPTPQISLAITDGTFTGDITATDVNKFVSGGTFSTEVPAGLCAAGFEVVRDAEGHYVAKAETAVEAKIGETKYATLAAAVAAATAGQTVTLLADITLTQRIDVNKNLTVDLGDKTITTTATCGNGSAFNIVSGTVTIQNGTIDASFGEADSGETDAITARSGSDVTLKNLNITVKSKNGACAYAFEGSHITIESGTYENQTTQNYEWNDKIKAMVFNQANVATQLIVIQGGTFKGYDPTMGDDSQIENVNATFLDTNVALEKDSEGKYVLATPIAKIGARNYASLDAAISVAVSSQTITLLADAVATEELPANVTIDAASHVVTLPTFNVADGAALSYASVINAPEDTYTVTTAKYNRTGATGTQWGTVCLPFSITAAPADYTLYTPSAVSTTSLTVTEVSYPVAIGTPVIFHKGDTGEAEITSSNASVKIDATPAAQSGGIHLTGTFTGQKITDNLSSIYFINGDKFHQAQQSLTVPAYRAYIEYAGSGSGSKPVVLSLLVGEQEATATMDAEADMASVESICNVNGNRLTAPQKGINIMKLANGKTMKLIIK